MKYGVATISLHDLDCSTAAAEIAQAGFSGVEWRVQPRANSILDAMPAHPFLIDHRATVELTIEAARETATLTRDHGLELIGLGPYLEVGDDETLALIFDMAVAAGAPQVRMQAPRMYRTNATYGELFSRTTAFFRRLEAAAQRTGVMALLEIHHRTICPSASLAHRLLSQFDHSLVGAIYDVGNLVWEGYEDYQIAFELLGPYLKHVHLKNAAYVRTNGGGWSPIWTPLEEGVVDVPAFITLLKDAGYDGWISIEDLSLDRTPLATLHHNGAQLREWGLISPDTTS
ncbi:MAG: sugar phosphate isomerase/epimerase [Actinomycetota bacterium]|nr:sugar phosphate isomerase/epimerase [Actinomycetota bacterium]